MKIKQKYFIRVKQKPFLWNTTFYINTIFRARLDLCMLLLRFFSRILIYIPEKYGKKYRNIQLGRRIKSCLLVLQINEKYDIPCFDEIFQTLIHHTYSKIITMQLPLYKYTNLRVWLSLLAALFHLYVQNDKLNL